MLVLKSRVASPSASHAAQAPFLRDEVLCARRLTHSLKGGHHSLHDLVAWLAARCHYPVSHEAVGAPDYLHSAQAPELSTVAEPLDHGVLERAMRALRGGLGRPLLIAALLLLALSWPFWHLLRAAMSGAPEMPETVAVEMVVLPPEPAPEAKPDIPTIEEPQQLQAQPEVPPPPLPEEVPPPPETAVVEPTPPEPPPMEELAPRPPEEVVQTYEPVAAPEPEPEPIPEPEPEPVVAKPEPPPPPVVPVRRPPPQPQKTPPKVVQQARPAPPQVQPVTAPPVVAAVPVRPAPPATTAAPQIGSAGTRAADALERYKAQVLGWLVRYKRYPQRAKMRNIEGEVMLRLELARDGSVISVSVSKSSDSEILDQGATDMVERAGKAPAIPDEIKQDSQVLFVPVPFNLK